MSEAINEKVKSKISEDLSPTKNLTGLHLKIVAAIAIIWSLFQLWYASPFPFWFNIGMFKGLPARAIHLGFALTLAFLIYPTIKGKKISILDIIISVMGALCCRTCQKQPAPKYMVTVSSAVASRSRGAATTGVPMARCAKKLTIIMTVVGGPTPSLREGGRTMHTK